MTLQLRALDPDAPAEVEWVAQGMRATLIEVEGEAVGGSLYTMDWLRERVRWHLQHPCAAIWLALRQGAIVGHSIVRMEAEGEGVLRYGLVSTTYVLPAARRQGVAQALLVHDEAWCRAQGLHEVRTWTGAFNTPLLRLYEQQGYAIGERVVHATTGTPMVCLARSLRAA